MSTHLERGKVLVHLGRLSQAEEELRRALAEQPNNSYAHHLLAWCMAKQERLTEARLEAEEAVRLQPDYEGALNTLGWILIKQRCWKEAEKALREAIRLNPQNTDNFFMLAQVFSQGERWNECAEAARQGLRLDPSNVNCVNSLAEALLRMNRLKEAQAILATGMAKDPENARAHIVQGLIFQERNRRQKALHHFQEAARIAPEDSYTRRVLNRIRIEIKLINISLLIIALIFVPYLAYYAINFVIDVIKFILWGKHSPGLPNS